MLCIMVQLPNNDIWEVENVRNIFSYSCLLFFFWPYRLDANRRVLNTATQMFRIPPIVSGHVIGIQFGVVDCLSSSSVFRLDQKWDCLYKLPFQNNCYPQKLKLIIYHISQMYELCFYWKNTIACSSFTYSWVLWSSLLCLTACHIFAFFRRDSNQCDPFHSFKIPS